MNTCEIFETLTDYCGPPSAKEKRFAVMLHPAPLFPDSQPPKTGVEPLAVFAANDDNGGWGWVNLNQEEKDCIGQGLLDSDAEIGKWYWCVLWEQQPPTMQYVPKGMSHA